MRVLAFCAGLIASVLLCFTGKLLSNLYAQPAVYRDVQLSGVPGRHPTLDFACQLPDAELRALFADPVVIATLQNLHASIGLSLIDLSPVRAAVVKQLNFAGIPVTGWLVLSPEEGYYLNAGNAPAADARFDDFQKWTVANGLRWARIGLDIEPGLQDFTAAQQGRWLRMAAEVLRRSFDFTRVSRARNQYASLIRKIQGQGYSVDTCQFPFLADERAVHSTLLERLFGIVDVRGDREVLMTYSSFNPSVGPALVWEYGRKSQGVVVSNPDWDQFFRDVTIASRVSPVVGIYNLEGCVSHGFLRRLESADWSQPVTIPAAAIRNVTRLRARLQAALWTASRLPYLAIAVLLVELIAIRRRRLRYPGC